jgi:hypothetical protein
MIYYIFEKWDVDKKYNYLTWIQSWRKIDELIIGVFGIQLVIVE